MRAVSRQLIQLFHHGPAPLVLLPPLADEGLYEGRPSGKAFHLAQNPYDFDVARTAKALDGNLCDDVFVKLKELVGKILFEDGFVLLYFRQAAMLLDVAKKAVVELFFGV